MNYNKIINKMKSTKIIFITLLSFFIMFQTYSFRRTALRRQETSAAPVVISSTSGPKEGEKFDKPDVGQIWDDLFTVPRTSSCRAEINKAAVRAQVQAEEERKYAAGGADLLVSDASFAWVKKWGFGPVAYLLDFFDPLFRSEVLKEFKAIHNSTMSEDPENTPEYSDQFDFASRISTAPPERQDALMRDLKKFEKTYDPIIFQISANSVQVMKAMKNFAWFVDPGTADYAADFVTKYDINHDGRLNPKELILGSIHYNLAILGSKKCNHCYTKIARRIGALHTYLDCQETGFINADQMWKSLPELRRPTSQFNIFGYGNSENIRTNAINDFVLKNEKAKEAYVGKEEFIGGILLGIWDRQVTENSIIEDDSRNLKRLRWSDNNMVDTAAYNYVKAITKAKIEEEEKERYARWERDRIKKALLAQNLWNSQQATSASRR